MEVCLHHSKWKLPLWAPSFPFFFFEESNFPISFRAISWIITVYDKAKISLKAVLFHKPLDIYLQERDAYNLLQLHASVFMWTSNMITCVQAFYKLSTILTILCIIMFSLVCIPVIEKPFIIAKSKIYFHLCVTILPRFHTQAHVCHISHYDPQYQSLCH